MKLKLSTLSLCIIGALFLPFKVKAQLELTLANKTERIDFDSTKLGVNNGSFLGTGITPSPQAGELNSNAWEIIGLSDGLFNFGDSATSGDYARGSTTLGVATGGIYSFSPSSNNVMLGFQPGGSDLTPGAITLKVDNNTGVQLDSISLSYIFYSYSDQTRSTEVELFVSSDNVNYTALSSLRDTSQLSINTVAQWVGRTKDTTFAMSIANGGSFYIRWNTDDDAGSGTRDEIGIDEIEITGKNASGALSISSFTTSNPLCNGLSTGDATVNLSGGNSPFTFNWSNGTTSQSLMNVVAGKYTITVSDNTGNTAIDSVTITEPDSLLLSTLPSFIACNGDSTGTISTTTSGGTPGYSYSWNTGDTTKDISNLVAGVYTVIVTDSNGCQVQHTDTIMQSSPLIIQFNDTNASCGIANGTIEAIFSNGFPSYTYSWSNGVSGVGDTSIINNLSAGTYTVTLTDGTNCQLIDSTTITNTAPFTISLSVVDESSQGSSDGSITANVTGGAIPYTYSWSGSAASTPTISNLTAGTYCVTVTDANGCTNTGCATVSVPGALANLIITEINYNGPEAGTDTSEFIEFVNAGTATVNLNGYSFVQGVTHTFTSNDSITSGQYFVIAFDSSGFRNTYGIDADAIWSSGGLSNGGEDITIVDDFGRTVDSVDFDDATPWPSGSAAGEPDGGGASIELVDSLLDNNDGANWQASISPVAGQIVNGLQVFGTPGARPILVGLLEQPKAEALKFYPNPTRGALTIELSSSNIGDRLQLINIEGKVLRDEIIKTQKMNMNLEDYSDGIYFVRIGSTTKKLILN